MGQRQSIDIGRGLFLVRYAGSADRAEPPQVMIAPGRGSEPNIDFILHPDHAEPVLSEPGTCLVVRTTEPCALEVEVEPIRKNGSVAATINIEPLSQGEPVSVVREEPQGPTVRYTGDRGRSASGLNREVTNHENREATNVENDAASDFRMLGHIAGIGDVYVTANEWLAGPGSPSRIEGIALEWGGKPQNVEVSYSVKTAQPQNISGRIVDLGDFAGTRGKAMPLTAVMLELSGSDGERYYFSVEALFLGSPVRRMTGQRISISGPSGREPLVGLRVGLEEAKVRETRKAQPERRQAQPEQAPARASGRVRVFRSRPKQGQSST